MRQVNNSIIKKCIKANITATATTVDDGIISMTILPHVLLVFVAFLQFKIQQSELYTSARMRKIYFSENFLLKKKKNNDDSGDVFNKIK